MIGVTEAPDLDFKDTLNPNEPTLALELAKDIAALSNSLGGHLVIGALTDAAKTRCEGFVGIEPSLATTLGNLAQQQAKDRCRPTPFVSPHVIDVPQKSEQVLVLRVAMSPVAPIGVSLRQHRGGKLVDEGWCFPYRVGNHTNYLSPDQFGGYESMSARRAAALLLEIPQANWASLRLRHQSGGSPTTTGIGMHRPVRLREVSLRENVARFSLIGGEPEQPFTVPLDEVTTVWSGDDVWQVAVRGYLHVGPRSESAQYYPAC